MTSAFIHLRYIPWESGTEDDSFRRPARAPDWMTTRQKIQKTCSQRKWCSVIRLQTVENSFEISRWWLTRVDIMKISREISQRVISIWKYFISKQQQWIGDLECEDISLKAFYPGQEFRGEMSITSKRPLGTNIGDDSKHVRSSVRSGATGRLKNALSLRFPEKWKFNFQIGTPSVWK